MFLSILKLLRHNTQILFSNKLIYFLLIALGAYILMLSKIIFSDNDVTIATTYPMLVVPAVVFVFYPSCFAIQNDQDNKIIELIFGIANYRYKVWLFRLVITYVISFVIAYLLSLFTNWGVIDIPAMEMALQVMVPTIFLSTMCFLLSCLIRNGNGSAVVFFLLAGLLVVLDSNLGTSQWNIMLNPFAYPTNSNLEIFNDTVEANRITFICISVVMLTTGLATLQNREKFI